MYVVEFVAALLSCMLLSLLKPFLSCMLFVEVFFKFKVYYSALDRSSMHHTIILTVLLNRI